MDIRYSCNQRDFKRYTTEETRNEMLITGLYKADEVVAVYSHVDRMVTLGCMPVHEEVPIDKGIDVWGQLRHPLLPGAPRDRYFQHRRWGRHHHGGWPGIPPELQGLPVHHEGQRKVTFKSDDPEHPAKFYMVSAPAHCSTRTSSSPLSRPPSAPGQR